MEEGKLMLNARFLEHRPVSLPSTNQKKVMHPAAAPQILPRKVSPPKPLTRSRILSTSHPFFLLDSNKPFTAPKSDVLVGLASVCWAHELCLVIKCSNNLYFISQFKILTLLVPL